MKIKNSVKYRHIDSDSTIDRQKKENEFKKSFGTNLQNYLIDNNIKIESFANGIGYDRQHVYGICSGKKAPSLFCLWRITEYLNVSTDYIWNLNSSNLSESISNEVRLKAQKDLLIDKINSVNDLRIIENLINNIDFASSIVKDTPDSEDDTDASY